MPKALTKHEYQTRLLELVSLANGVRKNRTVEKFHAFALSTLMQAVVKLLEDLRPR